MKFLNSCQSIKFVSGIFIAFLFLGALFWAKWQDPFCREWFSLKTADHSSVKCVVVLPKPLRQYPVVIYAHGWTGNLLTDGTALRQMAELGLGVVSLEYDQTNKTVFTPQFESLLRYLGKQKWVNTNAIAWVGFSMGANRMFDFVLQHPEQQPQLLVQLNGRGLDQSSIDSDQSRASSQLSSALHCPVLLVHGEQDETFPIADTKRLASVLQTNGVPVELTIISRASHGMEQERSVVFRSIGEYCLTHLTGKDAWQNYRSIAQWQADAPPLWLFWLPAAAWAVGWFAWWRYHKAASAEIIKPKRQEIVLRWFAVILGIWALTETAIHLVTPHFAISDTSLGIARRFFVQPKARSDFEFLAAQPIWQNQKLKTLLEHAELAGYNRELVNWHLNDDIYLKYVLSPTITDTRDSAELLNWRRILWEDFYPRIRHETSIEAGARIVVRHLRERVTIINAHNVTHNIPTIWTKQIADQEGFELIYVAALRSVGIPARLNALQQAECLDGQIWQKAPQPSLTYWQ